jgi:hypothetical protein
MSKHIKIPKKLKLNNYEKNIYRMGYCQGSSEQLDKDYIFFTKDRKTVTDWKKKHKKEIEFDY